MVPQIEFLHGTVTNIKAQIRTLLDRTEPLITTMTGISTTTGTQIVAEIGDVHRFRCAAAIVKYAGFNSGVNQSGQFKAKNEPITKKGSPYLRRSLRLAANSARQFDPKLKELYEKKCAEVMPSDGGDRCGPQILPHRLRRHARPSPLRS